MLSEEIFLKMESTMAMTVLDNHIERKTHEPSYEEVNEIENFDVKSNWEGYLHFSIIASSFFDFSMVPQDK